MQQQQGGSVIEIEEREDNVEELEGAALEPLQLRRLQDLIVYPREDLDRELKGWLKPKEEADWANIAKSLIALVNHGGGYLVFGFNKDCTPAAADRPPSIDAFDQDLVNGIVQNYAEPGFHCELHLVTHPQTKEVFPVVILPSGHRVPVRTKWDGPHDAKERPGHVRKDTYPIRRPGPKSEPPQTAQEWDALLTRCLMSKREEIIGQVVQLLGGLPSQLQVAPASPRDDAPARLDEWHNTALVRWRSLVEEQLHDEKPSRYTNGSWTCAYQILGDFARPSGQGLIEKLLEAKGHETGWPVWIVFHESHLKPYPFEGLVECWVKQTSFNDAAHSDFWRASPEGLLFLLRGYEEDSPDAIGSRQVVPGIYFDITIPIWRVSECMLHAERLVRGLGLKSAKVNFRFDWTGLKDRKLAVWASGSRRWPIEPRRSNQGEVTSRISVDIEQSPPPSLDSSERC